MNFKKTLATAIALCLMHAPTVNTQPKFFTEIPKLYQGKETAPKIVFVAFGSYNSAGSHKNYGYVQSLPLFLEKLLINPDLEGKIQIILIDDEWTPENYKKSDLYRYLTSSSNKKLLELFENNLILVKTKIPVYEGIWGNDITRNIAGYLEKILYHNGYVFLTDCSGGNLVDEITNLYNELIDPIVFEPYQKTLTENTHLKSHIHYFKHAYNNEQFYDEWWHGQPVTFNDRVMIHLKTETDPLNIIQLWKDFQPGSVAYIGPYLFKSADALPFVKDLTREKIAAYKIPFTVVSSAPSKPSTTPLLDFDVSIKDEALTLTQRLVFTTNKQDSDLKNLAESLVSLTKKELI